MGVRQKRTINNSVGELAVCLCSKMAKLLLVGLATVLALGIVSAQERKSYAELNSPFILQAFEKSKLPVTTKSVWDVKKNAMIDDIPENKGVYMFYYDVKKERKEGKGRKSIPHLHRINWRYLQTIFERSLRKRRRSHPHNSRRKIPCQQKRKFPHFRIKGENGRPSKRNRSQDVRTSNVGDLLFRPQRPRNPCHQI